MYEGERWGGGLRYNAGLSRGGYVIVSIAIEGGWVMCERLSM